MPNAARPLKYLIGGLLIGVIYFLGVACSRANQVPAPPAAAAEATQADVLQALSQVAVVYLGETHSRPDDHAAQLDIIQALAAKGRVAIALEMVQRPYQSVLEAYLAGEIDEAALVEQTEYEDRWGFPWEYYAPIVRFAKAQQIPLLALNTPTEVTRKVATEGLASLSGDDVRYIPPIAEVRMDNADYRAYLEEIFHQSHGGHGSALSFDNFFAAQVLWDETMAATIAQFRQTNPDVQVIVLAGQGHVMYGYGIPDRVARRLGDDLSQAIVMLNPDLELQSELNNGVADYFWFSEP